MFYDADLANLTYDSLDNDIDKFYFTELKKNFVAAINYTLKQNLALKAFNFLE